MDKDTLRQEMKKKRREFVEKEIASKKICGFVISMEEYKKAKCVCVYMSAFGEVDTSYIIEDCKKSGKKILVPVTDTETNTLSLAYLEGGLKKGAYGISEPENVKTVGFATPRFYSCPGYLL